MRTTRYVEGAAFESGGAAHREPDSAGEQAAVAAEKDRGLASRCYQSDTNSQPWKHQPSAL